MICDASTSDGCFQSKRRSSTICEVKKYIDAPMKIISFQTSMKREFVANNEKNC
jgi:hypothetical protein